MSVNNKIFEGEADVYRIVCERPRITIAELKNLFPKADVEGMVQKWKQRQWVSFSSIGDGAGLLAADRANDVLKELCATIEAKDKEHSISLEWSDGEWLRVEGDSLKGAFAPNPFDKRQREKVDIGLSEIVLVHQTVISRWRIPLFFDSWYFGVAIYFSLLSMIQYLWSWWIPCAVYVLAFIIWWVVRFYLCRMSATQIIILCARRMICIPFLYCEVPSSEDVKNFVEAVNARVSGEFGGENADDIDALYIGKNYVCTQCGEVTTKGLYSLGNIIGLGFGFVCVIAMAWNSYISGLREGETRVMWIPLSFLGAAYLLWLLFKTFADNRDCAECDSKKSMVSLRSRAGHEALKRFFGGK